MTNSIASTILVVDDDPSVCFFLQEALERDGYAVTVQGNGEGAIKSCETHIFDLVLLDIKLRGMDGMTIMQEIKKRSPSTAIILITGHASLESAVEALRQGASDYLFKPCKTLELRRSVAQALQKRQQTLRQQAFIQKMENLIVEHTKDVQLTSNENISIIAVKESITQEDDKGRFLRKGTLIIDLARHVVTLDSILLDLSPTEFDLLAYLMAETPRVISPQELAREVQGYASEPWEARDLARFHVYRIRQKIKIATGRNDLIVTVRGVGYTA